MGQKETYHGTLILDICSNNRKINQAIWLDADATTEDLNVHHHLGMFVDSVLISKQSETSIDVRFFNSPKSIEFYRSNVEKIQIINHLLYPIKVTLFKIVINVSQNETVIIDGFKMENKDETS